MISHLFVLFLILPITGTYSDINPMFLPKTYDFHDSVCIMDKCNIHIFITKDMPDYCKILGNVVGCAINGNDYSLLYMRSGWVSDLDEMGLTTFQHEALHILCECNFHQTKSMIEHIKQTGNPTEYVLKYKHVFQSGVSFDAI